MVRDDEQRTEARGAGARGTDDSGSVRRTGLEHSSPRGVGSRAPREMLRTNCDLGEHPARGGKGRRPAAGPSLLNQ